jgi:SAM-dependent methyltransferase
MIKKAIIHIGGHKTGTTSIQKTLLDNTELLTNNNINYPAELVLKQNYLYGQHSVAWYLTNKQFKLGQTLSFEAEKITYFFEKLRSQKTDLLLSSEELIWLNDEEIKHLKTLLPEFEFYIIVYIRRQDEAAPALYQTHVIYSGITDLFDSWIDSKYHGFDYFSIVSRWLKITQGHVIIRPYEKSLLFNSDAVEDFEHTLNKIVNKQLNFTRSDVKFNQTVSSSITGLIRYYNTQPNKAKIVPVLLSLGKILQGHSDDQNFSLISPIARQSILKRFYQSNQNLSKTYLGSEKLWFDDIIIDNEKDWQNSHFYDGDHLLALMNQCLNTISFLKNNNQLLQSQIGNIPPKNQKLSYKSLYQHAKNLALEKWIDLVVNSMEKPTLLADIPLPSVPPMDKQAIFHGNSGKAAIKSATPVYKYVLQVCEKYQITPIKTLLDFGCGWGRFTRLFVHDVEEAGLIAVDPWGEALQMSRQHMPYAAFIQSELEPPLMFRNNFFDVVFANSVFSHLSESNALAWIQEIQRILRPGGLLIATTHPKFFLIVVQELKNSIRKAESDWHDFLKKADIDIEQALLNLEQGQFVHIVTGQNNGLYGDSCVPEAYIRNVWGEFLELVEFTDDQTKFPQATFVLRKQLS